MRTKQKIQIPKELYGGKKPGMMQNWVHLWLLIVVVGTIYGLIFIKCTQ